MITGVVEGADGRRFPEQCNTIIDGKIYSARTDLNGNFMLIDLPEGSGYNDSKQRRLSEWNGRIRTVLIGEITNRY